MNHLPFDPSIFELSLKSREAGSGKKILLFHWIPYSAIEHIIFWSSRSWVTQCLRYVTRALSAYALSEPVSVQCERHREIFETKRNFICLTFWVIYGWKVDYMLTGGCSESRQRTTHTISKRINYTSLPHFVLNTAPSDFILDFFNHRWLKHTSL